MSQIESCLDIINKNPPQLNHHTIRVEVCEYCKEARPCMIYVQESNRIGRVKVCNLCGDKQLTCQQCDKILEGYPGQTIKEIRYTLTPEAPEWDELNHPLEGPIACDECKRKENERIYQFYSNEDEYYYEVVTDWALNEDNNDGNIDDNTSTTSDEVEIVYEKIVTKSDESNSSEQ